MAYRRPTNRFMPNPFVQETQEYPYLPGAVTRRPASRFMADPFKSIPGVQPQALPYKPGMKPEPEDLKPQKPAYKRPAPKPVQGAATRTPMPAAPAPSQSQPSVFGDMNSLMAMMGGMDPQQMKEMRERFQRISDASISRQRNMLDKMNQRYESTLENKKGILDLDWTPLLSLADNMTRPFNPTNYAQTYMQSSLRPESEMQRQRRLGQMEQGILAGERGLMNQEIQALQQGGMMGGGTGRTMLREMMRDIRDEKRHKRMMERMDKRYGQDQEKWTFKDHEKFLSEEMEKVYAGKMDIENVQKALNAKSLQRVQSVVGLVARMMGERGVLTEGDIGRQLYVTLGLTVKKAQAFLEDNPNTPMPKAQLENLKATIQDAMTASGNKFRGVVESRLSRVKSNPYYTPTMERSIPMYEGAVKEINRVYGFGSSTGGSSTGGSSTGGSKDYTDDQLMNMSEEEFNEYEKSQLRGN